MRPVADAIDVTLAGEVPLRHTEAAKRLVTRVDPAVEDGDSDAGARETALERAHRFDAPGRTGSHRGGRLELGYRLDQLHGQNRRDRHSRRAAGIRRIRRREGLDAHCGGGGFAGATRTVTTVPPHGPRRPDLQHDVLLLIHKRPSRDERR